jgi:HEAT repeat protein
MPPRLEDRLAAVERIAAAPDAAELALLRQVLRGKSGLLVAAAARVVGEIPVDDLVDDLAPAFANLLERPVERDPGCRGKAQIARTLIQLERWSAGVFERGVGHVQREPVWGGTEDTAAELRGICGIAYARFARHDALEVIAELLADKERAARAGAAQALGDSGRPDAVPLLRYKALLGDDEPVVLATCFSSMLALAPGDSLPFVARFLDGESERAGLAALALAEARLEEAIPILRRWCDGATGERRRIGCLALALLRLEPATEHLLDLLRAGDPDDARAAAQALATFKTDPALAERVKRAISRRDATLRNQLRTLFG